MIVRRAFALLFAAFLAVAGATHEHASAFGTDAPCAACSLRAASDVAAPAAAVALPGGSGFALLLPAAAPLQSRAADSSVFETGPPAVA